MDMAGEAGFMEKWKGTDAGRESERLLEDFLSRADDSYAILQLKDDEETFFERFASMKQLGKMGMEPNCEHYKAVYVGALDDRREQIEVLEGLYTRFNVDPPRDFAGHSLSVSDVVALKVDGRVSCHYVDSVGFAEMPDFIEGMGINPLRNAEMAVEDDYGMIDGIINNGRRQDPAGARAGETWHLPGDSAAGGRKSVLERLRREPERERTAPPGRARADREGR